MKNKLRLLLLSILLPFIVFSQKDSIHGSLHTAYISFGLGAGFPTGAYKANTGTSYRGFAKTGFISNFSAKMLVLHSRLGIEFMYFNYTNVFDGITYINNFPRTSGQVTYIGVSYPPNDNAPRNYTGNIFMAGLFYSIPFNINFKQEDCSFDFKFLVGGGNCTFPDVVYENALYRGGNEYEIVGTNSKELGFDFGAEARIPIAESKIDLKFGVNFYYANPEVNTVLQWPVNTININTTPIDERIQISLLTLSAGLVLQIGK